MYVTDWLVINSGTYNVKRDVVTVESNDTLYGYDAKFIAEVNSMLTTVIDEITSQLKELEQTQVSTAEIVGIGQFCFLRVCTRSCVGSCYYEYSAQACYCCRLYQNFRRTYIDHTLAALQAAVDAIAGAVQPSRCSRQPTQRQDIFADCQSVELLGTHAGTR